MGREVEEAQAHLAQSSEHPPVTSTFKSTEFPGARVTPEGQTTAGRRDGGTAEEKLRAVQDPGCAERLREWAPVAAGCERVTRPAPWRPAGGLKGGLLYVLYTFVTREIHLSYFSTFLLLGFRGWAGRGGGQREGSGIPCKPCALPSGLARVDANRGAKCPRTQVDLNTIRAQSKVDL